MSSQNQVTFETDPLLGNSRPASQSSSILPGTRIRFSPEVLLIPVAIVTRLATLIPSTTLIDLIRQTTCRIWNISHGDPTTLPASSSIPPELCNVPEVERYFATAMAMLNATEAILMVAVFGITNRISSRCGRKPAFLFALFTGLAGSCLISVSPHTPDLLADWVLIMGVLLIMLSGPSLYTYLVKMYIVDVCIPEDRTAALGKILGWTGLGTCISFALGGTVTTKTGNPLIVFYVEAALFLATLPYLIFALPESFSEEKRNALSVSNSQPFIKGFFAGPLLIFEPLKMLMPTRRPDGTRNWRLVWCAAHAFMFSTANGYVMSAWLVLATSKYHLTPAGTGLFLTIVNLSSVIFLTLIVPLLVRFLRPYYNRRIVRSPLSTQYLRDGEEPESQTSDRLDMHLAFVSCVISAISYLNAASSKTPHGLILSGICIGITFIHGPTVSSLVAGSVDPLKQGQALAAIDMVSNAGGALSPIIMGSILTATVSTTPLLMFYIHTVTVFIAGLLLFLVRDADKYQKPHET